MTSLIRVTAKRVLCPPALQYGGLIPLFSGLPAREGVSSPRSSNGSALAEDSHDCRRANRRPVQRPCPSSGMRAGLHMRLLWAIMLYNSTEYCGHDAVDVPMTSSAQPDHSVPSSARRRAGILFDSSNFVQHAAASATRQHMMSKLTLTVILILRRTSDHDDMEAHFSSA
jgi:hypothetical protein